MEIDNKSPGDINIGMIGFGYIAACVFGILRDRKDYIEKKTGKKLNVIRIAEKDPEKLKSLGNIDGISVSADALDVINDDNIDIVVELIGGVEPAFGFVTAALKAGKYVVTANKDMVASRGSELFRAAESSNVDILFEASVLGGIPIIGPLKTNLASDRITKIVGIVNGTTNYILTRMEKDGLPFEKSLAMAQELGYAEKANPSSDIEGYDAVYKLAILSSIAFNSRVAPEDIYREGITGITSDDINNAVEMGYRIKLLAIGTEEDGRISARVHPALIPLNHILASTEDVFNSVYVYGEYIDRVMSYGRGAGDRATAGSVVGDIINVARQFDRDKKGIIFGCTCFEKKAIKPIEETLSKFYILMDAVDRPGVLAKIAKVFGDNRVSINSMIQKQTDEQGRASLVFITHEVINRDFHNAIEEISHLDVVNRVRNTIRVEDLK
ncbi:MAG: homoserine dehydrogenase [Actinobacteria bacterium]|nr:homoserine dehydrogenase [Actinomycetota bacterium]